MSHQKKQKLFSFSSNRRNFIKSSSILGISSISPMYFISNSHAQASKDFITLGISQEPTVFHPHLPHIEVDNGVHLNLFNSLWGVDENGEFFPQLAIEVPSNDNGGITDDGLTWTIKLRNDVLWHDGQSFSAEDVKYTLELINNPDFNAYRRDGHDLIESVEVISSTEIKWKLSKQYAPYMSLLSWTFMVPKHILEKEENINRTNFGNNPIGTGPFKWKSRAPGDNIQLEANENYFGEGPHVKTIIVKYIPDLTVLYTQFKAGDIDYIGLQGISEDFYAEAIELENREVYKAPQATIEGIALNLGLVQFQEKVVRQALYLSMDKESIIDAIYYGIPRPTESYLPPESWAYNDLLPVHEYNPEKAKEMLESAGWKVGPGGIREKNGVQLEFDNSTTAGNQIREQAQQLLQQNWLEIGIKMNIVNHLPAVMWGENWMNSKFDSGMVGNNFMVGPDPDSSTYFLSTAIPAQGGFGSNTTQFSNEKVDELLLEGATTLDRAKRTEIYREIQNIIREELPYLFIFQYTEIEGTKSNLDGYKSNLNQRINSWNVNTWKWI